MNAGLIGFPLEHSFSETYFNEKFFRSGLSNSHYEAYPIPEIEQLPALLKKYPELTGLNVTIPYKESILPYLDTISDEAQSIGAVNTIKIEHGKLHGFNTDVFGFRISLNKLLQAHHRKALVLGYGGASKAVCFVLKQLKISYRIVSRSNTENNFLSYDALTDSIISDHPLIINTTPLGMAPKRLDYPAIPYAGIGKQHLLYDLIYNPGKTIFLIKGQQHGAVIKNGLEMLYLQAEKSWEIWNT